jgi:2-isopropylmalate synthase
VRLVHPWSDPGELTTEATVKVHIGDERVVATAEGNGPINALDAALRQAIGGHFPELALVHLTDYRVRVLETTKGTGAVTRVLLDSADTDGTWSTIGVSENIIEASWQALVDSVVFGLVRAAARAAAVESSGGHADDGELTPSSGDDEISTHPGDGDTATIAVAAVRAR